MRPIPKSGFTSFKVDNAGSCKNKCEENENCLSFTVVSSDKQIVSITTEIKANFTEFLTENITIFLFIVSYHVALC